MPDTRTFTGRKALGDTGELVLRDLLIRSGATVILHQRNRDAARPHDPGAAVAYGPGGPERLPDATAIWPDRPTLHFEAKVKTPLADGEYGWDVDAINHAARWSRRTGDPVIYAVRDARAGPLPAPGKLDDPANWCVASVWKLLTKPRFPARGCLYWERKVFRPLAELLDAACGSVSVPVVWTSDGSPLIL